MFNIDINDLGDELECALGKYVDDLKLGGVVATSDGASRGSSSGWRNGKTGISLREVQSLYIWRGITLCPSTG